MSALRLLTAMLAGLVAGAGPLDAAPSQAQQQAIRSACPGDFQTYCAGVQPGGADALQCLQKNVASLSATCQQAVNAVSGGGSTGAAPAATAPAASAPAAPAATGQGGGGATTAIVLKPRQEIMLMRQACGNDYRKYCSGTEIGGGRAMQCIVSHASSLSGTCRSALGKLGQRF